MTKTRFYIVNMFQGDQMPASPVPASQDHQLAPFRELLHSLCGKVRQGVSPDQELPSQTMENVDRMCGTELRDHLLAIDPLDHMWVARVNQVPVHTPLCQMHTDITSCFYFVTSYYIMCLNMVLLLCHVMFILHT